MAQRKGKGRNLASLTTLDLSTATQGAIAR